MTEKEMKHAIRNCHWKSLDTYSICRCMVLPCQRVLEKGECPTLLEILQAEAKNGCSEKADEVSKTAD